MGKAEHGVKSKDMQWLHELVRQREARLSLKLAIGEINRDAKEITLYPAAGYKNVQALEKTVTVKYSFFGKGGA